MRHSLVILMIVLVAACQGVVAPTESPTTAPTDGPATTTAPTDAPPTSTPAPTQRGIAGARDSVVRVVAEGTFYAPLAGQTETAGQGTGFIIDPSGIVVTNNHVVTGGSVFKVYFEDSTTDFTRAQLLGQSECSDLAVLQLLGDADYPALEWYEGSVDVGQEVQAAGYPEDTYSLREGQVTTSPKSLSTQWASVDNVIEHTAGILFGFSGGPLLTDPEAEVIAVNYAKESDEPRSFAIAASQAEEIVEELRKGRDVDAIGINGQAVVADDESLSGIWVASVKPGSPADRAQIIPGDLIVELGDLRVGQDGTMSRYCDVLIGNPTGTPLRVTWANIEEGVCYTAQLNTSDRRGQAVRCPDDVVIGPPDDGGTGSVDLNLIHASVRSTCTEATPWPDALASVSCDPSAGADSLWFDQYPDLATMDDYFDSQIDAYEIPSGGECAEGPNHSDWTLADVYTGRLLCLTGESGVWYQYTYDEAAILVSALRTDGDYGELWEWWTTADEAVLVR